MPFLRFSRDKRGYEHLYLVEASSQRGKPSRPRVLYWFRTPPGVKVGRAPFDPATQRALEAQNPGVAFDWSRIVATPMPPPEVDWRERRRAERAVKRARSAEVESGDEMERSGLTETGAIETPDTEPSGVENGRAETAMVAEPTIAAEPAEPVNAPDAQPPAPGLGHRRRRRGGRRRHRRRPESPAVDVRNDGLDQPNPSSDSSNEG